MYKNRNRKVSGEYLLVDAGDSIVIDRHTDSVIVRNVSHEIYLTSMPNREVLSYKVTVMIEPYSFRLDHEAIKENFTG